MRIGTWNLEGKWHDEHLAVIHELDCDVLLLTEVKHGTHISGMQLHASSLEMTTGRWWAAIASRFPMRPLPDPHGASAMAAIDGVRFCSSVLPWRTCGPDWPWPGGDTTERTIAAVDAIAAARPEIWGGDWNNAMSGYDGAGSAGARARIHEALKALELTVTTANSPHRKPGVLSIDHIAIPSTWSAAPALSRSVNRRVSDHHAYAVETSKP